MCRLNSLEMMKRNSRGQRKEDAGGRRRRPAEICSCGGAVPVAVVGVAGDGLMRRRPRYVASAFASSIAASVTTVAMAAVAAAAAAAFSDCTPASH